MIRNFIPLVPIIAASLFACGAAEPEDSSIIAAAETEEQAEQPAVIIPQGDMFRPVGAVDVSAFDDPETAPQDWRKVAPEQLILLKTSHGVSLIEMSPEFTPGHVAQFSFLARSGHFVGLPFHRVIEGFMAQAGNTALLSKDPAPTSVLPAEFSFRRSPETNMVITSERRSADAGFINGFKIASQNPMLASMTADGKVQAWPLHCPGAVAAARLGSDINSANAEFYITTSYPESLDKKYTVWGRVRAGLRNVYKIKKGEPPMPPDLIEAFSLVSDLDPAQAPQVWVMNTDSPTFASYLEGLRLQTGALPDVCNIDVPVIVRWP